MGVEYLNPETMHHNPAFTQAITVTGTAKTIYIGGQNAVNQAGEIVGTGDMKKQVEQIFINIQHVLDAAEAKLENIVKWNVYIVQGQDLVAGFEAFQKAWGNRGQPPTITSAFVAGLAHPDFLCEIDAIAVVPDQGQ